MLACDVKKTRQRQQQLKKYFEEKVLSEKGDFVCAYFDECKNSRSGEFYEGQLHHIGNYYDLIRDGESLRIVVIGMSYGHPPARVTMEERRERILDTGLNYEFKAGNVLPARNPHMKGTTLLLRQLFKLSPGTDHESEFLQIDGHKVHMFDAFAMINYLLCSAVEKSDSASETSTSIMQHNCQEHFRKTLEILEPTIAVVQGRKFVDLIKESMDDVVQLDENGVVFRATLGKGEFSLLLFSHPSTRGNTNWSREDSTYFQEIIVPAVKNLSV